nr:AraC family transcriptional regulator [Paraburkholderia aspalathi]
MDRNEVSRVTGIEEADIASNDARVPGDKHVRMLQIATDCFAGAAPAVTDVSLALQPFPELAGVVCNSATLKDALRNVVRYRDLIGNVDWLLMHEADDEIAFDYVIESEGRTAACALGNFALIACIARLYDPRVRVCEASVIEPGLTHLTNLRDSLGVRVQVGQPRNRLILKSGALKNPFEMFNPVLAKIYEHSAREVQGKIDARGRFSPTVERHLRDLLCENAETLHSNSLHALVCERLSLTRWSLQRRLAAEQSSFRDVLMRARIQHARDLLAYTHAPIKEVSEKIGFASTAAFTRFFTRACGCPPKQFRERHRRLEV